MMRKILALVAMNAIGIAPAMAQTATQQTTTRSATVEFSGQVIRQACEINPSTVRVQLPNVAVEQLSGNNSAGRTQFNITLQSCRGRSVTLNANGTEGLTANGLVENRESNKSVALQLLDGHSSIPMNLHTYGIRISPGTDNFQYPFFAQYVASGDGEVTPGVFTGRFQFRISYQ